MKPISGMDIQQKVFQYRYHLTATVIGSVVFGLVLYAAPRLLSILSYFWPLFASTTVFIALIMAFGGGSVSKLMSSDQEKAGEGILDYVAGQQPQHFDGEPDLDYGYNKNI